MSPILFFRKDIYQVIVGKENYPAQYNLKSTLDKGFHVLALL